MNNSAVKTIIFFSLHYPFHFSDSYLDDEFNQLAQNFDRVIIISSNTFSEESRKTPLNAVVYRFTPNTVPVSVGHLTKLLFQPFFYVELCGLLFRHRQLLSAGVIKELFAFYSRAMHSNAFLKKVIDEQKVSTSNLLVYTYWMIESSLGAVLLKKEIPAVRVISRAHSLDVYFERSPVKYHPFRRFIFNHLDRLYFISQNAKAYFTGKHFISQVEEEKIRISRIGIAAERNFSPSIQGKKLRIISVAYVQKLKRIDLIIDTLSRLTIPVEWVHVGHSNHNPQDFEDIQKYAEDKLGAKANISYRFTGKTSKEALFALYAQQPFDVFLNVSETEGIPVSMMEAMSYSVPVIGTNVGGVAEIIIDSVNGFLLSPYPGTREVEQALLSFFNMEDAEKSELRRNAFDTWNTSYNAQINNEKFVADVMAVMN